VIKYTIETKKFSELKGKIEIPRFQRGLVWSHEKKAEFIKSLKAGLPIGVLLLSPQKTASGKTSYLVIDGLQRFTTMMDYANDYFQYIEKDEITDLDTAKMIMCSPTAQSVFQNYDIKKQEQVKEDIRAIFVRNIGNRQGKNANAICWDIAKDLCNTPEFDSSEVSLIQPNAFDIVDRLSKEASIDEIIIPAIVFEGNESELASVFQKLNQEGVKLTKYDVFAATWINHTVTIKDDEFIDFVIKKYSSMQDASSLEISNYDPDVIKKSGVLTVYEYAFALGKALRKSCDKLFKKTDESKTETIGFLLLAEIMGLSYNKMSELAETVEEYKDHLDFKALKDALVESCKTVEKALGAWIVAPTKQKTSLACHSELQLASYIIVLFKLKYELTKDKGLETKTSYSNDLKDVKSFLYKHYLYDILRNYWAGSGDNKLEEIISSPKTCRYVKDVDKQALTTVLTEWLSNAAALTVQKSITADTKLLLNYILRGRNGENVDDRHTYDIEHCVPQEMLNEYFIDKGIDVAVSSACNLIYIPTTNNRSKKDKTYYGKQDIDPATYVLNDVELRKLVYPSREELQFVNSTDSLTKENYYKFLDGRVQIMRDALIDSLYSY